MSVTLGKGTPPPPSRYRKQPDHPTRVERLMAVISGESDFILVPPPAFLYDEQGREIPGARTREQCRWHGVARDKGVRIETYSTDDGSIVVRRHPNQPKLGKAARP